MVLFSVFKLDINGIILYRAFYKLLWAIYQHGCIQPNLMATVCEYATIYSSILLLMEFWLFIISHYWKMALMNIFCTCFLGLLGPRAACIFILMRQCQIAHQNFLHSYWQYMKYSICQSEGCEMLSYCVYSLYYSSYQKGVRLFI